MIQNSFQKGLGDGTPIGLGYFSVSFAFGISAAAAGVPVWGAALISMSNVTSAGQFAGLSLMTSWVRACSARDAPAAIRDRKSVV